GDVDGCAEILPRHHLTIRGEEFVVMLNAVSLDDDEAVAFGAVQFVPPFRTETLADEVERRREIDANRAEIADFRVLRDSERGASGLEFGGEWIGFERGGKETKHEP